MSCKSVSDFDTYLHALQEICCSEFQEARNAAKWSKFARRFRTDIEREQLPHRNLYETASSARSRVSLADKSVFLVLQLFAAPNLQEETNASLLRRQRQPLLLPSLEIVFLHQNAKDIDLNRLFIQN